MIINRKIVPIGLKNNPNRKLSSVSSITIYCTDNYTEETTARAHAEWMYSGSNGQLKSWHYTVDKDEIWQHFDDDKVTLHTNMEDNDTSIGIKICVNDKDGFKQACINTAELVKQLLEEHNLSSNNVIQDTDNCPLESIDGQWSITWNDFIKMIRKKEKRRGGYFTGVL